MPRYQELIWIFIWQIATIRLESPILPKRWHRFPIRLHHVDALDPQPGVVMRAREKTFDRSFSNAEQVNYIASFVNIEPNDNISNFGYDRTTPLLIAYL